MTHTSSTERTGPAHLTARQLVTLRLMAEGHTDDAIAKRLGLSGRTVRRIATELMTELGARSRFAAGVHAVRRGWLPADDDHDGSGEMLGGHDPATPWPPARISRAGHGPETLPRGQELRRGGGRRRPAAASSGPRATGS